MKNNHQTAVHILATVRNPALLDATRLVFQTIRTGFPSARIEVYGNALEWYAAREMEQLCEKVGAIYTHGSRRHSHDAWIENLILTKSQPFWICDTDMVFFHSMEITFGQDDSLAGELQPDFHEEWTQSIHVERLHTCCMWIDPVKVRCAMREWMSAFPHPWGATAQTNLIRQMFIPARNRPHTLDNYFYDTCAGLWQAGIGTPFTRELAAQYEHLQCGTYADKISRETESLRDLQNVHRAIYADPSRARGLREKQQAYYDSRQVDYAV